MRFGTSHYLVWVRSCGPYNQRYYFLLFSGWDASPLQGCPYHLIKLMTHLYTWVERGTVKVKCLAKKHSEVTPARAWIHYARSGVQDANHWAPSPPRFLCPLWRKDTGEFSTTHVRFRTFSPIVSACSLRASLRAFAFLT